jgi:hypothetical protein
MLRKRQRRVDDEEQRDEDDPERPLPRGRARFGLGHPWIVVERTAGDATRRKRATGRVAGRV